MLSDTVKTFSVFCSLVIPLQVCFGNVFREAQKLEGNPDNGRKLFTMCIACHQAEGWGSDTGHIPQIAGQHPAVIINQFKHFNKGFRSSAEMKAMSDLKILGGVQGMADLASYISSLPMIINPVHGSGEDVDRGKAIFNTYCAKFCHGRNGEGNNEKKKPRIQGQHYVYLLRQLKHIRDGVRKSADKSMVRRLKNLSDSELEALADYVSRIKPDAELLAPENWKNPDFH